MRGQRGRLRSTILGENPLKHPRAVASQNLLESSSHENSLRDQQFKRVHEQSSMTSKNIGLILRTPEAVSESDQMTEQQMERRMQDPSDQAALGEQDNYIL